MTEVINSWPWYDRAIAGFVIFAVVALPFGLGALDRKLNRIIDLLERRDR